MMEDEPELHWTPQRLPVEDAALPVNFYQTHVAYPEEAICTSRGHVLRGVTACNMPFIVNPALGTLSYDTEVTCYACLIELGIELDPIEAVAEAEAIVRGLV